MSFWKNLFNKNEGISTEQKMEISAPILTCSNCKKEYKIGINAMAASLDSAAKMLNSAVVLTSVDTVRQDIVKSFDKVPIDEGQKERTMAAWNLIKESLKNGQKRRWKCYTCNTVNFY